MKEADIVLTPIPQADGIIKNRPVLLLRELPLYRDFLVCGISTQIHQEVVGFDNIISSTDPDFATSGLRSQSLIRLVFLAVIPRRKIIGSIGNISAERHQHLLKTLSDYLVSTYTELFAYSFSL
ncbi:MAG: type II toxin-antitoxin system PemK/MazF family toxin [Jaaginema sp. PMC 1079.18]|nr:type II toxin-antitoxin system PemK/MazF family toxin [Jaaginema sp. PMC 1080.18]MEC4850027.1 type II toxin-antitoxin system PemK/MazF family toxin [Jaaginema sp. PMC 1079.18]MEC4867443.1 type II toxin-antitoxin system PemK/MazF family toxin [Jaaginema sp. PMC 1078.18]